MKVTAKGVSLVTTLIRRGLRVDDVFVALMVYAVARTNIYNQIARQLQEGEYEMIDVSTFGPPAEFLMSIVFVTALMAGLTAFIVTAIRKGDVDKKNGTQSDWDLKYILGSVVAAVLGGAIAIVLTPMLFEGLGIDGASGAFYAIVTGIVAVILTRWCIIGIHEGPLEVLKDFKNLATIAKDASEEVKEIDSVKKTS